METCVNIPQILLPLLKTRKLVLGQVSVCMCVPCSVLLIPRFVQS